MTSFTANRNFPNPITVTDDPRSHTIALQQVIEALNIGQRRTREIGSSYVRVQELVDVGLIEIVGNQLKLTNLGTAIAAAGVDTLAELTDVDLTGLSDGDTLVWNSTTSKWEPGAGGSTALADLTDVNVAGVSDGESLIYDSGTGNWVPGAPALPPVSGADMYSVSLNDLSDVSFYMPSDGDILRYNSTLRIWEADFLPGVPLSLKTSGTLDRSDRNTCVPATGGVTVPADTFSATDIVSIFNDSAAAITLTQGSNLTLRLAGTAATGNRTLAAYGLATIWFRSTRLAVISGAGVT